jgi:hypothetical protein
MLANGIVAAKDYLGITTEFLGKAGDGKVIRFGRLDNFDTSSYSVNDTLYLSTSTIGGFTTTQPTGSNVAIATATVLTSSTNGSIWVNANNIDLNASGSSVTVDSTLSTTSTNPVENQAVTNEINTKQDTITGTTDLIMNELTTNGTLKVKSGGSTIASVISDGIELESGNNCYLRNNANLFYGRNSSSQTPGTTAVEYYAIFGKNTVTNSDIYSYSVPSSSDNTGIRLLKAGKYKVSYTLNWANSSYADRVNFFSILVKHSSAITPTETELPGSRSFGYARDYRYTKFATTTCVTVIDVAANEYIKCKTVVAKNDSNFGYDFSGVDYHQDSSIVIEYLGDV